jgi:hypothetical protein
MTISATIANSGNMITETGTVTVRFFDGDPSNGGVQIGGDQTVSLRGCGHHETISVVWPNLTPGVHPLYVVVDPDLEIDDSDRSNNTAYRPILVAAHRAFIPLLTFGP